MNCTDTRRALWPPERPRLAAAAVLKAQRHRESCPACQEYFAQDRRLLDAYDRMRDERAPRHVRERVFDSLARERAGALGLSPLAGSRSRARLGRLPLWSLVAVASIVGVLAGSSSLFRVPAAGVVEEGGLFVEDYLRRAVGEDNIVSSSVEEISGFLTRELGIAVTPMEVAGLLLAGAEICLLDGRRGAMIRYTEGGREISHYVIPKEGAARRDPAVSSGLGSGDGAAGPAVITWATPQVEQALVGELPAERLLELARNSSLDD